MIKRCPSSSSEREPLWPANCLGKNLQQGQGLRSGWFMDTTLNLFSGLLLDTPSRALVLVGNSWKNRSCAISEPEVIYVYTKIGGQTDEMNINMTATCWMGQNHKQPKTMAGEERSGSGMSGPFLGFPHCYPRNWSIASIALARYSGLCTLLGSWTCIL